MGYPDYTAVVREVGFLHKAKYDFINVNVLPSKIGEYAIPVLVCAKGIHEYHTSLILNVVK